MNALNLNDLFWTVQGEGEHSGRRALFVRMPFCNLACTWCDTTFDTFRPWGEDEFLAFAAQEPARFAVITGGEPLMNKHTPRVVHLLKDQGFYVAAESNGTVPPNTDLFDFITVSPKRFSADRRMPPYFVHEGANARTDEFKYVVDEAFDLSVLARHDTDDGRRYSLSPEYGSFHRNVKKILEFIKENPAWRISLQTHKVMDIP